MDSIRPVATVRCPDVGNGSDRLPVATGASAKFRAHKPRCSNEVAIINHEQQGNLAFKNDTDRSRMFEGVETLANGEGRGRNLLSAREGLSKVAIVDDDTETRFFLQHILEQSREFRCVGSYASGEEALREVPGAHAHIVLMDIRMPGMSGIECMRSLKGILPRLVVVLVSGIADPETMAAALAAGGDGYLTKPFTISQCLATLTFSARRRRTYALGGLVVQAQSLRRVDDYARLTKREDEVMHGLAKGLLYKEIADNLHISSSTVNKHQHNIFRKLHVSNRTEAVTKWLEL